MGTLTELVSDLDTMLNYHIIFIPCGGTANVAGHDIDLASTGASKPEDRVAAARKNGPKRIGHVAVFAPAGRRCYGTVYLATRFTIRPGT